ncbi:UDP-glycosyltransferase UGT5-like [Phlebotomus argentipes]|uniref:UDP-glycosyltransferase UGT5-like n=1 Tax=Phlebotomus argentipes TaxID=94469 RepID=UPI002892C4FB|nr:UDP-glycosyltransferase UGT5-like [Phlebotomus argentipes]
MLFKAILVFLFYFLNAADVLQCERILAVFPIPSQAHFILGHTLVRALESRGHQITFLTPFRLREQRDNVQEVYLHGAKEFFWTEERLTEMHESLSVLEGITQAIYGSAEFANFTLSHAEVQKLIRSEASFDLLLVDSYMMDALLGLAHHYRVPSVVISASASSKWTDEMVGNPHNPAHNPNIFLALSNKMSLPERIVNSLLAVFVEISYQYMYLPAQEVLYQRFFAPLQSRGDKLPPLEELIHNVSCILVNSHPGFHYPRALMPSVVEIGGIHMRPPKKLPLDVENFFSRAIGGVVVLSLGAHVRSADMPKDKRDAFNRVFQAMPEVGIFWKWEEAQMSGQADNVIVGPWMPQMDLLSQANTKLFITSGGLLGIYEAVLSGTPILGLPLHADQHHNIRLAVEAGFARSLNYDTLTEESIREAVEDMLKNDTYRLNADRVAGLLRENLTPIDEKAVHNIEMVLRTRGARHLRPTALDLATWQLHLVDVTLCIAAGCLLILAIPAAIIGVVLRRSNNASNSVAKPRKTSKGKKEK